MRVEGVHLDGATVALTLDAGRIVSVVPQSGPAAWVALPLPVDPHVHLDKTFTWPRAKGGAPGLFGAIDAMKADVPNWTEGDLRARAGLALVEAFATGTRALRTHVDWVQPATPLAWRVLGDLAADWRGRVAVQRAALVPADLLGDPDHGPGIARAVAQGRGVLGAFVYRNDDLEGKLARIFRLAADHGLRLDFHVDEGLEVQAQGFDAIVAQTAAYGMAGRVLCGHACALSVRPEAEVQRVLGAAAVAGVGLCVLPATNLWLQDDTPGRTPRLRGLAPLHEARAAGVSVCFGADNVADPFYPLGSYDALETLRLACTAAHLDPGDWVDAITAAPARALGLPGTQIAPGEPADLILIPGADLHDALRRPAPARRIVRAGVAFPEQVPA